MGISFRGGLCCVFSCFAMLAAFPSLADDAVQSKVIYGADDRIDVYQESDPARLQWAAATCALINASKITGNSNGTYSIFTDNFRVSSRPACEGEPFANQPTAAFCSGFLAAPDIVVTAGHCITDNNRLNSTRYVFGFVMTDADSPVTTIQADQLYSGTAIVGRRYETSGGAEYDYSVIKLDRPVTIPGVTPLPIRREGIVPIGANVGVIGYPTGLPEKIAFGAQTVVQANDNAGFFIANLDTYGGNSGSPVFNAVTGIVEGILVRGNRDYDILGFPDNCFRSNRLSDSTSGEDISKSLTYAHLVPLDEPEGEGEGVGEGEGEGVSEGEVTYHSADADQNHVISLSETLRVIQLYNADVFHCDSGSEDGFATGAGDQSCAPHSSDFRTTDFTINLSELLRLIQLLQAAHYAACDSGEDGFCV